MRPRIALIASLAVNLLLVLYIVRQSTTRESQPAAEGVERPGAGVESAQANPTASSPAGEARTVTPPVRTFTWEAVESPDYREYIANLRAIGCPEETIRDIIVADVNKLYAAKKRAVRGEPKKFEYWKAGNPWMAALDAEALAANRALDEEKLAVLRQLGIEPDLKMQMASLVDPADALGSMFGFLPEAKQVSVMQLMQDMQTEMAKSAEDGGFDAGAMQAAQKRMEAAIKGVLSPEEFREYELRMSMTANTMRSQLAGFDPSEQEFLKVYDLRKAFDDEFSLFGRGDETEAERQRRTEAERQLNEAIKQSLGEARYADYERAQDWTFQQIQQAAKRADLGTTEAVKVYEMKKVAEAEARNLRNNQDLTQQQRLAALEGIQAETERSIKTVLGEKGWQQYNRNQNTYWLKSMVPQAPPAPAGE
ncbi:MAG: hypothetical protein MUC91_12070 [Verrucomicrobia bacterium]|nr:hypothetical protein [Verrucomicrobiota bacterium]